MYFHSVENEVDYQKHYENLIERAKTRVLDGYVEVHHIKPRCMGGADDTSNLVQLTPEEHYVAHQLLHKMYPDIHGLTFALVAMTGNPYGYRSNKLYGWVRKKAAKATSILSKSLWEDPKYRERHKASMDVAMSNPVFKAKISKLHKGRIKSARERANIAEAGRNRTPRKFSEQARANMAEARRKVWEGRRQRGEHLLIGAKIRATRIANGSYKFSEEHKAAIGRAGLGRVPWNKGISKK